MNPSRADISLLNTFSRHSGRFPKGNLLNMATKKA